MVSRFSLFATIRRVRIPVEAAEQSLRRERMAEIESTKVLLRPSQWLVESTALSI